MHGSSLTPMSAFASVYGLFHSTAFQVARNVTVFFVVLFWLGLAYWVHRDARRRIDDPWLVGTATVLGLVPFAGPLVYLLFRPPETLEDAHARRAEIDALEWQLLKRAAHCPVCHAEVEAAFLVCPVCTTELKVPCVECAAPLDRLWQMCPYCATPVTRETRPTAFDLDAARTAEAFVHGNGSGARPRRAARARKAPAGKRAS